MKTTKWRGKGRGWAIWGLLILGSIRLVAASSEGDIVAQGRGFLIRRDELEQLVLEQTVLLESRGQKLTSAQESQMEIQVLDRLIMQRVLLLRATEEDRRGAKTLVEKGVAEEKARVGDQAYRRQLLVLGVSPEVFEERLLRQAVADQVVIRELRPKVTVTDEQIRAFYEEGMDVQAVEVKGVAERLVVKEKDTVFYRDATNRLELIRRANLQRLERPAEARVRMLSLLTVDLSSGEPVPESVRVAKRERIEALRKRVLAGENLGTLAQEFSEETDAKEARGEYVARKEQVAAELRPAMFEGPLNEVSEVITGRKGFYLVQVLSRTLGGKVGMEEAKRDITELLTKQETEKRLPDWIKELRSELGVQVNVGSKKP